MDQQRSQGLRENDVDPDGTELGASFEAYNSPSYGGDVGAAFEEQNAKLAHEAMEKTKPSHTWIWVTVIVAIVIAVALVYHFSGANSAKKESAGGPGGGGGGRGQQGPPAVAVGQSKSGDMNVYITALGTVTPANTVTIYSQITGKVLSVHYREGQLVRRGDPLVDIDPAPYEATLAQAEGSLKHDQASLAQAQIDLARYQAAFARNAIAKQQLDDQEQAVKQFEGTVQADQGTIAGDKVQLAYCHIVAPISGRVGLRLVDPGNIVFSGTGSTLAVLAEVQPITVVFNVSEDNLPQVQAQLKNKQILQVDAFDRGNANLLDTGKLISLNNQIDTTTGTIKFRASFANKDFALFPNQFVNARLLVNTLKSAVLIPTVAVQHNGTASFVYVVKKDDKGDLVAVQPITTLTNDDINTAVTGIPAGTQIATSGFDRLENGVHVSVAGDKGQKDSPAKPAASGNTAP
jgi:multidrug efflux system membrane fusion protein